MPRCQRLAWRSLAVLCLVKALLLYAPAFAASSSPIWYLAPPRGYATDGLACADVYGPLPVIELPGRLAVTTEFPDSLVCSNGRQRVAVSNVDERSQIITLAPMQYAYHVTMPVIMAGYDW